MNRTGRYSSQHDRSFNHDKKSERVDPRAKHIRVTQRDLRIIKNKQTKSECSPSDDELSAYLRSQPVQERECATQALSAVGTVLMLPVPNMIRLPIMLFLLFQEGDGTKIMSPAVVPGSAPSLPPAPFRTPWNPTIPGYYASRSRHTLVPKSSSRSTSISRKEEFNRICHDSPVKPFNKLDLPMYYLKSENGYDSFQNVSGVSKEREAELEQLSGLRKKKFEATDYNENSRITANQMWNKIVEECQLHSVSSHIQQNFVTTFLNEKAAAYGKMATIYRASQDGVDDEVIGNCGEVTISACVQAMPKLKPDQEVFIIIETKLRGPVALKEHGHVYGIIASKDLCEGDGIKDPVERKAFREQFFYPFFQEGKSVIKVGDKKTSDLFLKGYVSNESDDAQLCDPYLHVNCNISDCRRDEKIAVAYLEALQVTQIRMYTMTIPKELKPKVSPAIQCANKKLNEKLEELRTGKIEPAVMRERKKVW